MNVETDTSGPGVHEILTGRHRRARTGRGIARVGCPCQDAHELIEESQLLRHKHAVLGVDATDLDQHSAKLGGLSPDPLGDRNRQVGEHVLEGHLFGVAAEPRRCVGDQPVALLLELRPPAHLLLHVGDAREHRGDVLGTDRLRLGDEDLEQPPGRGELALHMGPGSVTSPPGAAVG